MKSGLLDQFPSNAVTNKYRKFKDGFTRNKLLLVDVTYF